MIRVPLVTVQHTARVASLRAIVDATEAVDSYCVDYLDAEGAVDLGGRPREGFADRGGE